MSGTVAYLAACGLVVNALAGVVIGFVLLSLLIEIALTAFMFARIAWAKKRVGGEWPKWWNLLAYSRLFWWLLTAGGDYISIPAEGIVVHRRPWRAEVDE